MGNARQSADGDQTPQSNSSVESSKDFDPYHPTSVGESAVNFRHHGCLAFTKFRCIEIGQCNIRKPNPFLAIQTPQHGDLSTAHWACSVKENLEFMAGAEFACRLVFASGQTLFHLKLLKIIQIDQYSDMAVYNRPELRLQQCSQIGCFLSVFHQFRRFAGNPL
jgi:hypothetical protein